MKIAIIGGTGHEGKGMAVRWARAGVEVVIGSRDEVKALKAAEELNHHHHGPMITGRTNPEAAAEADQFVVLTVPHSAHKPTLKSIKDHLHGKILIDVTVPLDPENPRKMNYPPEGSALEEAMALLGDSVKVIDAFQNVAAGALMNFDKPIPCDILVVGDDKDAKIAAMPLIEKLGVKAYNAGPASNARIIEGMTSVLIGINIREKLHNAGIKVVQQG